MEINQTEATKLMNNVMTTSTLTSDMLAEAMRKAGKKIAPVWPLESFVAVNPYLGMVDQRFDSVAQTLAAVGGIQMTMPLSFYIANINNGKITREDLQMALTKKAYAKQSVDDFISQLSDTTEADNDVPKIYSFTDVAAQLSGKDWNRFITNRVSAWAASYFDHGQAMWKAANQNAPLFLAWKAEAEVDRTPEISGLKNFRKTIKALPDGTLAATQLALEILGVNEEELPLYLHRLLLRVGGWAAYVARLDWDSELYGGTDGRLIEFLSSLICWEAGLYQSLRSPEFERAWQEAKSNLTHTALQRLEDERITQKLILQEAFDNAAQRELISKFKEVDNHTANTANALLAQAVFCIDVRSEVFRRNLESVDNNIETLGFAGFFGFPINFVPLAHSTGEAQCPVLIPTGPTILETLPDTQADKIAQKRRVLSQQLSQLWKSFRSGAVTCFSFVSPIGLSYLLKLFTDSFGITRPVPHPDKKGIKKKVDETKGISLEVNTHNNLTVGIPIDQRLAMAKNALKAMSLGDDLAPFVLIVGHGSTTVNNPHATGLDCGACGGHTGEANAKVAAAVLNDNEVRRQLAESGLVIPEHTVFLACLHDTTTDEVTIYNAQDVPQNQVAELNQLKNSLLKAGQAARTERAVRMAIDGKIDRAIFHRSKDWSQVRPEWGLAGCSAFVVAPRERTKNINLQGRSFLHSYNWQEDQEFAILEVIMTAPMVVTSWINLQYYASTVDNKNFGSGNKTLHNVTAGLGVLEGFAGDLRVGLPLQSVHDGEKYQHEPLKLNVVIEAPIDAMNAIIQKHENVKQLCDNGWITLLRMDENGEVSHRYAGELRWDVV